MTPANDNRHEPAGGRIVVSNRLFAVIAAVIVGLTIVAALAVSDPPWVVRDLRRDQNLVQHLNAIQQAIAIFYRTNTKLPAILADLLASPQTVPYGVTAENLKEVDYLAGETANTYRLCATFLRASGADSAYSAQSWKHDAGHQCFPLKVPEKSSRLDDIFGVQRL